MDDTTNNVSSELYDERDYTSRSKPTVHPKNAVSRFPFKLPGYGIEDKEGDLIVPRNGADYEESVEIEHSINTSLPLVGLQIWRGCLLLADWLLDNGKSFSKEEYLLELGTGVGLTSIIASMFCPVVCTDVDRGDILKVIRANIVRNKHLVKHPIDVMELDFTSEQIPERVLSILTKVNTVIAADVIYDDDLTDAFVRTVKKLLDIPPVRTVLIALEKRYVFTISDCDTCAPCYDYFRDCLNGLKDVTVEEVKTDFPQYFLYDRSKELVLCKITSAKN